MVDTLSQSTQGRQGRIGKPIAVDHRVVVREASRGGVAPDASLGRTEAALGGHPCLTENNSIDSLTKRDSEGNSPAGLDWQDGKFYYEKVVPCMSGYHHKATSRMQKIIELAILEHGRESLCVIHLTFADGANGPPSYQVVQDRLNSLATNVFARRYRLGGLNNWFVVCERGERSNRLHFHVLAVKQGADFFTGSRKGFNKKTNKKTFHPNRDCRAEFDFYQTKLKSYGFGCFVRIEPLWHPEAGAKYFSKYVGKGHYTRDETMKGKQLVRYASGFAKYHSAKFNMVGGFQRDKRQLLQWLGPLCGASDLGELNDLFGSRWQYYASDQLKAASALYESVQMGKALREWVNAYIWARWKVRLFFDKRSDGSHICTTGLSHRLKPEFTAEYLGRTLFAPDHCWEAECWVPRELLLQRAERDLLFRLGEMVMGDLPFGEMPDDVTFGGIAGEEETRTKINEPRQCQVLQEELPTVYLVSGRTKTQEWDYDHASGITRNGNNEPVSGLASTAEEDWGHGYY